MTDDGLQDSPICQVWMMFTEAISFRKVGLVLNYPFYFFLGTVNHLVQKDL